MKFPPLEIVLPNRENIMRTEYHLTSVIISLCTFLGAWPVAAEYLPGHHACGIDGEVRAVVAWNGGYAVAGEFQAAGETLARNVAWWDGAVWHPLGEGIAAEISALTVYEGDLIAGLRWHSLGTGSVRRWNGSTWTVMDPSLVDMEVKALTVYDGVLFCGRLAWDGGGWVERLDVWGEILAFAEHGGLLLIGGAITGAAGEWGPALWTWDGETYSTLADGPCYYDSDYHADYVVDLHTYEGTVLAAVGGPAVMYRWDGITWHLHQTGYHDDPETILIENVGSFGGLPVATGLQLDSTNWRETYTVISFQEDAYTKLVPPGPGKIHTVLTVQDGLLFGGAIPWFDGVQTGNLVRLHAEGSDRLGSDGVGIARDVLGLITSGSGPTAELFVHTSGTGLWTWTAEGFAPAGNWGGDTPPEIYCRRIWSWTIHDGALHAALEVGDGLPTIFRRESDGFFPLTTAGVNEMTSFRGHLTCRRAWAGSRISYWHESAWHDLAANVIGEVRDLTVWNDQLIVVGKVSAIDGLPVDHAAAHVEGIWEPLGGGFGAGTIQTAYVHEGELYVGGDFTTADGTTVNNIARWDGARWQPLGEGCEGHVWVLASYEGNLVAGGELTAAGGQPVNNLAVWDGARWHPLGSGTDGEVRGLAVHDGQLFIGGFFHLAGGMPAANITRWAGPADGVSLPEEPEIPTARPGFVNIAPNPFNPGTHITYRVPHAMQVKITIHDLRGRLIVVPLERQVAGGEHEIHWDGRDRRRQPAPTGTYLVTLKTNTMQDVRKIALVR